MVNLIKQKKSSDAMIRKNPAFLSKNADAVECPRSARLHRNLSADSDSVCRSGDIFSGTASPGNPGPDEDNGLRASEVLVECMMVMIRVPREDTISGNLGDVTGNRKNRPS